jgi:hypothetical protein
MTMPEIKRAFGRSPFWHRLKKSDSIWNQKINDDARNQTGIWVLSVLASTQKIGFHMESKNK